MPAAAAVGTAAPSPSAPQHGRRLCLCLAPLLAPALTLTRKRAITTKQLQPCRCRLHRPQQPRALAVSLAWPSLSSRQQGRLRRRCPRASRPPTLTPPTLQVQAAASTVTDTAAAAVLAAWALAWAWAWAARVRLQLGAAATLLAGPALSRPRLRPPTPGRQPPPLRWPPRRLPPTLPLVLALALAHTRTLAAALAVAPST